MPLGTRHGVGIGGVAAHLNQGMVDRRNRIWADVDVWLDAPRRTILRLCRMDSAWSGCDFARCTWAECIPKCAVKRGFD
jgi:hypothetical protein